MFIKKNNVFNRKSYIALVKNFTKLGYVIRDFDSINPNKKHLILGSGEGNTIKEAVHKVGKLITYLVTDFMRANQSK